MQCFRYNGIRMMPAAHTSTIDSAGYEVVAYRPPPEKAVRVAIREAVAGYQRVFGERLAFVWLFGSRARGDHRPDSDVDLLVVLHEEKPMHVESDLLCSVSNPIRRSCGVFIDGHPTTLEHLENSDDDFHYFVRKEGRRVDA